ncbi:hypothetical protein Cni_G26744 [Canna indica]|uniref:Uncharacterized protein n=1 Tax=Canna indica TaxID=4628 RepID=A0AAQ3L4C8_9LILI|nr:hypothetical protein Cni_G26744 [Canna indica]
MMLSSNSGPLLGDPSSRRLCICSIFNAIAFFSMVFVIGTSFVSFDFEKMTTAVDITRGISKTYPSNLQSHQANSRSHGSNLGPTQSSSCKSPCILSGAEQLPQGIVRRTSDMEVVPLWGPSKGKENISSQKSILAIPVGIKQKDLVNRMVMKFASSDFTVVLFHYDGIVDEWKDLQWSDSALHISVINQTKWWFAKRFLHPDIVASYKYIFLWDEDLEVEDFHPERYLKIVEREGLEISQPALDPVKSKVHHQITARLRKGDLHRRTYKFSGGGKCYKNSSAPPCTGWIEMMAPVFSRTAWRCVWHMIQSDLIHAWGLDMKLGYCVQGDRSKNVGVVDSEYIVHKGLPTLGGFDNKTASPDTPAANDRFAVRQRSYIESEIFKKRWQEAVAEDNCWTDPYPEPKTNMRQY